jgi:serine/threonine protein kinase
MSTPDRSIENDKTLIGKNDSFREQSLGRQGTITNENKRGKEFPEASHGMDLKSRYEIISSIGQGGMGHVYLAQDRTLARKVAIKRIKSHSESTVRRFLVEARAIAQLTHYNIVQIFDYGHDADGPYLILEYVDGGTLADLLKAGPLQVDQSINITCRLAEGLVKAHELGIIHRDIKPANILMTKDGQPKLTDFGLARDEHTDSAHTVTGAILGTIDFMSPEQLNDATSTDARSDLWSLAVTFYQMVTGKSPRMIKFNLLPSNLKDFVIKALEDDPAERYQNAREFLIELSRKNIAPAIQINPKGEIQTGECVSCHTINESNRKYCRKCAKSLRTNCLECEVDAPVWDNICGECGANQSESFQKKTLEYKNLITECNNLILNMELGKATDIVNQLIKLDKFRYGIFADQGIELKDKLETVEFEMQKKIEIAWQQASRSNKSTLSADDVDDAAIREILEYLYDSLNDLFLQGKRIPGGVGGSNFLKDFPELRDMCRALKSMSIGDLSDGEVIVLVYTVAFLLVKDINAIRYQFMRLVNFPVAIDGSLMAKILKNAIGMGWDNSRSFNEQ